MVLSVDVIAVLIRFGSDNDSAKKKMTWPGFQTAIQNSDLVNITDASGCGDGHSKRDHVLLGFTQELLEDLFGNSRCSFRRSCLQLYKPLPPRAPSFTRICNQVLLKLTI